MLTIRPEHIDAFNVDMISHGFEQRTYAHLQEYFPRHCKLLGKQRMLRVIQQGREQALDYGFTAECCVRTYIEFMCLLGSGYGEDPLLPWAGEVLNDHTAPDQVARADRLYDHGWDYINHIARDYRQADGEPTTARFVDWIKHLRAESDVPLNREETSAFSRSITARLKEIFPAKFAYVGQGAAQKVGPRAVQRGQSYGINAKRGASLLAAMMWVLGNGFDRDLLLPWISETLNDPTLTDPTKKVDKLMLESVGFLNTWWDAAPAAKD